MSINMCGTEYALTNKYVLSKCLKSSRTTHNNIVMSQLHHTIQLRLILFYFTESLFLTYLKREDHI